MSLSMKLFFLLQSKLKYGKISPFTILLLKVLTFLIKLFDVVEWDFNEIYTLLNEIKAI